MIRADWVLLALLGVLTFSTFTHDWSFEKGQPVAHLVIYWFIPASIYWIARQSTLNERTIKGVFIAFAVFGVYLTVTALTEAAGQWSFVFPEYIASSTHQYFGRARGPFLNPVALGIYLTAAVLSAMAFWPRCAGRGNCRCCCFPQSPVLHSSRL